MFTSSFTLKPNFINSVYNLKINNTINFSNKSYNFYNIKINKNIKKKLPINSINWVPLDNKNIQLNDQDSTCQDKLKNRSFNF